MTAVDNCLILITLTETWSIKFISSLGTACTYYVSYEGIFLYSSFKQLESKMKNRFNQGKVILVFMAVLTNVDRHIQPNCLSMFCLMVSLF